jgi:hypothetical protein
VGGRGAFYGIGTMDGNGGAGGSGTASATSSEVNDWIVDLRRIGSLAMTLRDATDYRKACA